MFLKKYASKIIIVISIFCISIISSYYLKNGFNKKLLTVEYKFPNYFLLSQNFIHPYIELVNNILEKEQYIIRDEVLRSEKCKFLKKDVTSFLIKKERYSYIISIATNDTDPTNNISFCLDKYLFKIDVLKKNLFQQAFSLDLKSKEESIAYFENLLIKNESSLETALYIDILSDIRSLKDNVKEMRRFLEFINRTETVNILDKELKTFEIHPVIVFVLTFILLLTLCIIFRKIYFNKNLLNKIFN